MENGAPHTSTGSWKRLKRNKAAIAGLVIIILSLITSIFAYYLAPDHSPYANRIILETGGRKPGSEQLFLKLKKAEPPKPAGFFSRLISGVEDRWTYLPITTYRMAGDSILVEKYIDDGLTETQSWHLNAVAEDPVVLKKFILGTDKYGRDILSRLIIGVRISLAVGVITVLVSLLLGLFFGAIAGYFGGRTDDLIMWWINIIWSIPSLLLVFAITLVLGKGFMQVFLAIGLTMWVSIARLVRGQVIAIRGLEYVEAARALGFTDRRIIIKHILPNIMGPVMVLASSIFATAIIIEAGLSFLGIGVQPPQPSWGLMIKENYNFIITQNPALALAPGFAIMLLVLAFNLLGNGLRDAFDVRERY